jgi:Phage integrase, N-terminal SAM-like domain
MPAPISCRPRPGARDQRLLDRRILPVLGSKRVDRIKPADIERYYAALRRGDAPGGGELSAGRRPDGSPLMDERSLSSMSDSLGEWTSTGQSRH